MYILIAWNDEVQIADWHLSSKEEVDLCIKEIHSKPGSRITHFTYDNIDDDASTLVTILW